jgi:hypothetical protein
LYNFINEFRKEKAMKTKLLAFILLLTSISFFVAEKIQSEPRRVLLEFCTGTWCQWCPCGDWAIETQILPAYPQTVVLAYHGPYNYGGDPFTNFNGYNIIPLLGFSAYPTGIIDRTNSPSNPYVTYDQWFSRVQQRYAGYPNSVIDMVITTKDYNTTTRLLTATINATATQNLTGQYKISYIITENNVVYYQVNNNVCDTGSTWYVHKWIVRNMVNGETGENVNTGNWNQNQTITKNLSTTLDTGWVASNCNLIVFIYKEEAQLNLSNVQQSIQQSVTNPLGVQGTSEVPLGYSLSQNYPNPFNPSTNIKFTLPKDGEATLKIYDALGNEVATYLEGFVKAGTYNAVIDGSNWSSGVYFYKLTTNGFTDTKKMTLVK